MTTSHALAGQEPVPEEPLEPARWSDAELAERVAARIARPKLAPADSFVLHAPLELLARSALLPLVEPPARSAAREAIERLGDAYMAAGPELADPRPCPVASPAEIAARLADAVDAGELDDADAAAAALAAAVPPTELPRLIAGFVVPRLGAAAHGGIFLFQLPRVAPRSRTASRMLRGLVRELALEREWSLSWYRTRSPDVPPSGDLVERLLAPPSPGDPGSNFIIPTMSIVERSALARELLDAPTRGLDVATATRLLGRLAAWSMLQDDPAHAPYGWSHCLTMPQGVLGVAEASGDAAAAIAVAATYVLGFRATLGTVRLDPSWQPMRPSAADAAEAFEGSPDDAAAAVWHAPDGAVPRLVAALATRAALHHDAHLVKYTVACLDAAAADAEAARLYLAAAAFLSAWWRVADRAAA
jgi:hypothetical protein